MMEGVSVDQGGTILRGTPPLPQRPFPGQHEAGMAPGINIEPGYADDGWIVPPRCTLADGTFLQLYKDGEALHAAFDAIHAAQRRICLEVYIFRSDPTGRAFADLLCQKARQGLSIYVIYDSLGSLDSDPAMFEQLASAGVRLGVFHPVKPWDCRYSWRPFNRDHRKLLIIDDDIAGLGGLNVGAEYAGSWIVHHKHGPTPWRDNAVGLRGPSARLLLIPFARMWRYLQHGGRLRSTEFLHNVRVGSAHQPSLIGRSHSSSDLCDLGVLGSVPTRSSPLVSWLRNLLARARSSILLTMSYFAPPDELIDELCRAARRGVRVRLMLPGQCDVRLLLIAARSFYETLLSAGVEVYERQGAVLHAKTLCVDRHTTVLGSTNLDYRSIEYNCELSLVLRCPRFAGQMHDLFDNDVRFARRITLDEWRHRPLFDRFVQWAVWRARYLL